MNTRTLLRISMLAAILAFTPAYAADSARKGKSAAAATRTKPSGACDFDSSSEPQWAEISQSYLATDCTLLRGTVTDRHGLVVREVTDPDYFATFCPVPMTSPSKSDCGKARSDAIGSGFLIRVDNWGSKKLSLMVKDSGGRTLINEPLSEIQITPQGASKPMTIGYQTREVSVGTADQEPVIYVVYLANKASNHAGFRRKHYLVEVYEKASQCYKDEFPSDKISTLVANCTKESADAGRENSSGGGSEPPPK